MDHELILQLIPTGRDIVPESGKTEQALVGLVKIREYYPLSGDVDYETYSRVEIFDSCLLLSEMRCPYCKATTLLAL